MGTCALIGCDNETWMLERYCGASHAALDHAKIITNPAAAHQPEPKSGQEVVLGYVLADLKARAEVGKVKYGTYLQTGNGRDALWDALQECYDLAMYLRQAILERDLASTNGDRKD